MLLQLVYVSSAAPGLARLATSDILDVSRRNNRRDGITGLLYADRRRFLQVLEGPRDAVEAAYARIQADPRHRAVVSLSRREIAEREFGDWAMAELGAGEDADAFIARVHAMVASAAPDIRGTFAGFAEARRAA